MKIINRHIKYFCLITLILITSLDIQAQSEKNIKIISYNIWNGFDWGKDMDRKERLISWVNSQNPDVMALQELCAYTPELLAEDAKKWGHPYSLLLKTTGYSVGLTSNKPIELLEKVREGMWHGMLHCKTYGIDFFVVHLSPADYATRKKEAAIIVNKVKSCDNDKFVVLGDYNAHSPFDETMLKKRPQLLEKYRKNDKKENNKYKNLLNNSYDYSVVASILGLPTIDIALEHIVPINRFSFPTPILFDKNLVQEIEIVQKRERIDYILLSPVLAKNCIEAQILNDGSTDFLSDHFPVSAMLTLK